jgi:hypothetical protein
VAGADEKCQVLARASGNPTLTGRLFAAWISVAVPSPSGPAQTFAHDGWFVLPNETLIAADWADLTNGSVAVAINVTELGGTAATAVWTGTMSTGSLTAAGGTCNDWTTTNPAANGRVGDSTISGDTNGTWWSSETNHNCDTTAALYCFER